MDKYLELYLLLKLMEGMDTATVLGKEESARFTVIQKKLEQLSDADKMYFDECLEDMARALYESVDYKFS